MWTCVDFRLIFPLNTYYGTKIMVQKFKEDIKRAMSRISGLSNDMNKRIFYKERKNNNRSFDFLSKQNIIVPLILDINDF